MSDLLNGIAPERKDKILQRAEELVREERMRRGRSAPESNQDTAAAPSAVWRYLQGVLIGIVVGVGVGYVLGHVVPRRDDCSVRASSAHVSVCLDGSLNKAKGLLR